MPRIHAIADGVGVHAITLCGFVGMRLPVPIINLFTLCYRPVEGVFNLIAFSGVRDEAHFVDHERYEGQYHQSPNYKSVSASYAHGGPRFRNASLA